MRSYQSKKRRKRGAQKGNLNADGLRKFSALAISDEEVMEKIKGEMQQSGLGVEIAMLRFVMKKLMKLSLEVDSLEEMMRFTRVLGMAGDRLAAMVQTQERLFSSEDQLTRDLLELADQVLREKRGEGES